MAHSYTPGLRTAAQTVVRKRRILPISGQVLVHTGQVVTATTVIAQTELPGKVHAINVVNLLGIVPQEIRRYMLKREGDAVKAGEPLAENRPVFKWLKTQVPASITGTIETVSEVTGQVFLREPPRPLALTAYLDGQVVETIPDQGATVETVCSLVQGIFGIGGEAVGTIAVAVDNREDELTPERITDAHRGMIVVGGSLIDRDGFARAKQAGVAAVVVGGIHALDLKLLLGRDLGVAITGTEQIGPTLIITEGFGRIAMAKRTFDLLVSKTGRRASCSGATQIRAGVIRPEVIVPMGEQSAVSDQHSAGDTAGVGGGLRVGDQIRIIREPYFGRICRVSALPADLRLLATGSKVRVLEAEFDDGQQVVVPRANVELLEA
ncbi:MAG: hypothetical protein F9K13_08735 [Candidatus Methylomirabilis oxygeniifera]|uniref:KOW domain-containing protein n=1 Tax=Methylomirabilis oxygeniifera TaxID=671143 RepID=D5MJ71_METO1|nr:MAG: hypothetical protein F9K13_08735 [Candidatus Methylomirabilis oxyfera]CBE67436.1 conserved protein of unknown function [Candidatus Methylomirabilis oxyfera]